MSGTRSSAVASAADARRTSLCTPATAQRTRSHARTSTRSASTRRAMYPVPRSRARTNPRGRTHDRDDDNLADGGRGDDASRGARHSRGAGRQARPGVRRGLFRGLSQRRVRRVRQDGRVSRVVGAARPRHPRRVARGPPRRVRDHRRREGGRMTPKATLEYLGTHWPHSGNLYTMRHPDGREARVFVDSLGETWVDVRIIPDGGYFYSERVAAWRA